MSENSIIITGPFTRLLTMDHLPLKGSLKDSQLELPEMAGIVHRDGKILETGRFSDLCSKYTSVHPEIELIEQDTIALPGFIDPHTHLCWAGSREADYAQRLEGKTYAEIAKSGGGIWDTVTKTRMTTTASLKELMMSRASRQLKSGVTTCEVKSGYALDVSGEIRLLEIIRSVQAEHPIDLVPTCLAAHIKPRDFEGDAAEYLSHLSQHLFPEILLKKLANRIDIFVEEGAFNVEEAAKYLFEAKRCGFELVVHGDQFTGGGAALAVRMGARSVDHLEEVTPENISLLASSGTVAVVLPGSSMGLGARFAPARKLLDQGCCLAIGSDWNPGSAPMGDLLLQTAVLGAYERLTNAEQLAAITVRAAHALNLEDRGILKSGYQADFIGFPAKDFREILYNQGMLKPSGVWKKGMQTC